MLSLGPLFSDLSVASESSVADRFWPFVLAAFLLLAAIALYFALHQSKGKKGREEGDGDDRTGTGSPRSGDEP